MKVTFGIFFLWLSITCISPSVKLVMAKNKIYKGRSPNVERYLNSCGREVDISGLIAPNLAAGARLAAKNESQALDEKTSRTYELSKSVANLTNYLPKYRNVLTPFEFGGKIEIPTCMHKRAKTYS